ncbi:mono/diheme cytochrome c family protein [Rhodovulum iodosum]|uniref:Mono/diheme cytochrome c family protein n=1 Tax=Rhodovulum iodosum TaxID=68291 RepID=A0ABV3XX94_9RHOB|nr:c-type cytochrome [Rhodovulum robiginosum]RSK37809.1 c-type cytochrome [Rhodovulum robiginosum]
MRVHSKPIAAALAALPLLAGAATAQDDPGKAEYMNACAACHGANGVGDGPLAELMTVPMPNLTQLSAANDGAFPMLSVIQVIDGRTGIRGHGYPMPVWGDRFKAEATAEIGEYAAELMVRGRVLSIAYFVESLQQ